MNSLSRLKSDSRWSRLNKEQRERLEKWLFDDGLRYSEVLEKARNEFGVTASLSSLKRYRARVAQQQLLYQLTDGKAIARCPKRADGARKFSHAMASRLAAMKAMQMFLGQPEQEKNLIAFLRLLIRDNEVSGTMKNQSVTSELKRDWLALQREMAQFKVTRFLARKRLREKRVETEGAENGSLKPAPAHKFP